MTDIAQFDYELPEELVATAPARRRDASRLLGLEKTTGALRHWPRFEAIKDLLRPGDVLVLNDARVLPARLTARRRTGGKVDILLVHPVAADPPDPAANAVVWLAMLQSTGTLRHGETLSLVAGNIPVRIDENVGRGYAHIRFDTPEDLRAALDAGCMPLPPYIRKARRNRGLPEDLPDLDRERYQTVYGVTPGAVAAPTAGLHFTQPLLDTIRQSGVHVASLTLLVGPGTFQPVRTTTIEDHNIEPEFYHLPQSTADSVRNAIDSGRRVIATGTTSVRVLEHVARTRAWEEHRGWTDLYIHPPWEFRAVDALITNFHLPRSTLLMLVCAMAGREHVLNAYREAVRRGYRFYSYGDATFLY